MLGSKIDVHANQNWQIIQTNTQTHFDWLDRLRILFGRIVHTSTRIYTRNEVVDIYETETTTHVEPIIRSKKRVGGYAVERAPESAKR